MSQTTKLIRRLARELRYRSLDDLIGRYVTINHLDSVEGDIHAALMDVLPQGCKYVATERHHLEGAIVKYGIIDATFTAPEHLLHPHDRGGIPLLKELGFIDEGNNADRDASPPFTCPDTTCLDLLAEGIDEKRTLIKLFLASDGPALFWIELIRSIQENRVKLPDSYLPRTFKVEDACLANSDFAWFEKHLYL